MVVLLRACASSRVCARRRSQDERERKDGLPEMLTMFMLVRVEESRWRDVLPGE
jgi:hypothetical protein